MAFANGSFFANELGAALEETPEAIVRSVLDEIIYKVEHGLVRAPTSTPTPASASPALPTPLPVHVAESVLAEDKPSWAAIVKNSNKTT
jgi:hypothetical protein